MRSQQIISGRSRSCSRPVQHDPNDHVGQVGNKIMMIAEEDSKIPVFLP